MVSFEYLLAQAPKIKRIKGMKSLVYESRKLLHFALVCAYHSTSLAFTAPFSARGSRALRAIGGLDRKQWPSSTSAMMMMSTYQTPPTVTSVPQSEATGVFGMRRLRVKALQEGQDKYLDKDVTLKAWVRTVRTQKGICFVELNDGSSLKGVQVVVDQASQPKAFDVAASLTTGSAVEVVGKVVASPAQGQKHEVAASNVVVIGACPADTYPLQKKRHTLEYLRSMAHLRPRTNTIAAVSRVRSELAYATHKFFQDQGFLYLQTPIITGSDCEGAGAMFRVTSLPSDIKSLPKTGPNNTSIDYSQDFFKKPAYLTVSGQLNAESYACAMGDVYTFGPTFRAENSQTTRHLAEFNMIEPEMAFADLNDNMDNAEAFVKYVVQHVLDRCGGDLEFFQQFYDKALFDRLQRVASSPFARVPYGEAVELLKAEISKDPSKWSYNQMHFGVDLQTEHEKWLAGTKFDSPVFVYNYPKEIKSFYMRDNEDGKTVAAMDLLMPNVGELIGGSQREERLDVLEKKIRDYNLDPNSYAWYLDLRKFGSVPHSGYGLGFERLVCYVTGMENIRDAIAFPRYPGHAEF